MNNDSAIERQQERKRKVVKFFTHLICILILFILPELVMSISNPPHPDNGVPWGIHTKSLVYILVFYLNYCVIIDYSLRHKHGQLRFVGYNILLLIVAMIMLYLSWQHFETTIPNPHPHPQTISQILLFFMRDMVIVILTITLSYALKISDKWKKLEQQQQALLASQREVELKSLKSQLNPHFLFNTLNTIYALVDVSPQKAQNAVHEMSQLLRYVLYESSSSVTLSQEIAFIENYINLMKLRLNGIRPIEITLDAGDCADYRIAPLLFISLIENAFKYGNTGNLQNPIKISITANAGIVTCHTFNHYDPDRETNDTTASGIGMSNMQRRLDLLYGNNATLNTSVEDGTYSVTLTINMNQNFL